MSLTDAQLLACVLVTWDGDPAGCRWCGKPLTGRARRWCSNEHSWAYARNHSWTEARHAAVERDGHRCTICGVSPDEARQEWGHVERLVLVLTDVRYTPRVVLAMRSRWLLDRRLEVDHITPILGKHSTVGCHHHLDGLRTLCHRCHLAVTAEQFGRVTTAARLFDDLEVVT